MTAFVKHTVVLALSISLLGRGVQSRSSLHTTGHNRNLDRVIIFQNKLKFIPPGLVDVDQEVDRGCDLSKLFTGSAVLKGLVILPV